MPTLYIQKTANALWGVSTVVDDHQKPLYILDGKHGLRQDSFVLYTLSGDVLGEIKQMSLGLSPSYQLFQNQEPIADLKKIWGVWHEFVYVTHFNWLIIGDLTQNQYRIVYHTQTIMQVKPVMISTGTAFQLTISDDADLIPCILIAAVLNRWAYSQPKAFLRKVGLTLRPNS